MCSISIKEISSHTLYNFFNTKAMEWIIQVMYVFGQEKNFYHTTYLKIKKSYKIGQ